MLRSIFLFALAIFASPAFAGNELPKPLLNGLKNPESVIVGLDGRIYVSEIGEFGKDGDGRIMVVDQAGQATPFATGLDDPKGLAAFQKWLFVADKTRIWKIDEKGKAAVFVAKEAFPHEPLFLNDMSVDEKGTLYVSDSGDLKGNLGAIYGIDPKGKVRTIAHAKTTPVLKTPNGLVMDGVSHLLLLDFSGDLSRIRIADGKAEKIADGFEGGDGLAWDWNGQLFISSWKQGKVWGIARPGQTPVIVAEGFESAADLCLDPTATRMLVPDMKAGTLTPIPLSIPKAEFDARPLALQTAPAFPKLKWTGWQGFTDDGKVAQLRPIFLTHAGDGSNRNFVTVQQGTIHVFPNDPNAEKTKVFLDIEKKVYYSDKENEQGLLGLAFHPNFKKNGEFFVFYSLREPKLTNIVSRFRVSKEDPDRADPSSEEEIIRFTRPFWNHDGGTLCFGPDGYLYIAVGDGGAANDPFKNGQKLATPLAKILRIDVNHEANGKKYAIPKDNPFTNAKGAAPETWAFGLRNPWRMAFDRKTGVLWAADVGQNLYEEINLIVKGGNYGWSVREGLHPFGNEGVGPRKELIDPIWEYHHDAGRSITGGIVYRGKRLPELEGHYLYGDFITGRLWALKYDPAQKRVIANRPLPRTKESIFSFGEDEAGEAYFLIPSVSGQSILHFVQVTKSKN